MIQRLLTILFQPFQFRFLRTLLVIVPVWSLGIQAIGATFYVSLSGNDANEGTVPERPWRTIQAAADRMEPGDTALVAAGDYAQRVLTKRAGLPGARITFKSVGSVYMKGFEIRHSYVTVDGFIVTGTPTTAYQGAMMFFANCTNSWLLNSTLTNLGSGIYPVSFVAAGVTPWQAAQDCVVSNNFIYNTLANMVTVYGARHLIISNVLDLSNRQDAFRVWGTGTRITGNFVTRIGNGLALPGHPDILQIYGDNGHQSYNHLFDNNLVSDSQCQLLMTSQDGIEDIRDITFFNNTFIRVQNQANCSIPGLRWYNNTFYKCASEVGVVLSFGISMRGEVIKGRADRAELLNNLFFMCGSDPSNINYGYYTIDPKLVGYLADHNYVCGTGYSGKRVGCPPAPFYFCEPHGISGGNPGFLDEDLPDLRLGEDSLLRGRGKAIPGFHGASPGVDIGARQPMARTVVPPNKLRVWVSN